MSHSIKVKSNEKSLVQFDYEKAVSNYLGTQSTFKVTPQRRITRHHGPATSLATLFVE